MTEKKTKKFESSEGHIKVHMGLPFDFLIENDWAVVTGEDGCLTVEKKVSREELFDIEYAEQIEEQKQAL